MFDKVLFTDLSLFIELSVESKIFILVDPIGWEFCHLLNYLHFQLGYKATINYFKDNVWNE